MYAVKTEQFEGPFDLLLGMIEKQKMSINDISLAKISSQYLEHVRVLENFPIEEAANFMVIASTLMLIKSRSLMPSMELTEEEEQNVEELQRRLKIYQFMRNFAVMLCKMYGKNPMFARESFKGVQIGFIEPKGMTIGGLRTVLKNIIENLPQKEILPETEVRKVVSLEEKMRRLTDYIETRMEFSFFEFSGEKNEKGVKEAKLEIIISFLAMLELVRQGFIMVRQTELFDNIDIRKYEKS